MEKRKFIWPRETNIVLSSGSVEVTMSDEAAQHTNYFLSSQIGRLIYLFIFQKMLKVFGLRGGWFAA